MTLSDTDRRRRDKVDMQRLIGMILASPISKEKVLKVDGELSIDQFKGQNTDVKTRMLLQVSMDAMHGDIKAAEFLMKYGGFEPPKEAEITIETPTFIDDMTIDATPVLIPDDEVAKLDDKKRVKQLLLDSKTKEDVITDTEDIPVVNSGRI